MMCAAQPKPCSKAWRASPLGPRTHADGRAPAVAAACFVSCGAYPVMEQTSSYEQESGKKPVAMAICSLAIIIALVVGVGLASNLVLRDVVQTLPLWIAVVLGFRRSRATGWVALPLFLFCLTLMVIIWLYLL